MLANAYSTPIAPKKPCDHGAGLRSTHVTGETAPGESLEMNMVAIWHHLHHPPLLFISIDTLYSGAEIRQVAEASAPGIPPENIIVAASHTHQAPMLDNSKQKLGRVEASYFARLCTSLERGIRTVLDPETAQEVQVWVGSAEADHSINRRRRRRIQLRRSGIKFSAMEMAPNRRGSRDETVTLMELRTLKGISLASVWNYACHPVSHPAPEQYSAHYIAQVRTKVRQVRANPTLPVLFFQGFSGDTRPRASTGIKNLSTLLWTCLLGPYFRRMLPEEYRTWAQGLAELVAEIPLAKTHDDKDVRCGRMSLPGSNFIQGLDTPVTFQALRLGQHLAIYTASAELVSQYALRLRQQVHVPHIMCVGCTDASFGYVPTRAMIIERGYESEEFCEAFGYGPVSDNIEDTTLNTLERLSQMTDLHHSSLTSPLT